jgi:hypothetical protein
MSRGILFLRLEVGHLCPKDTVLSGGHDARLRAKAELFGTTRDRKCLFEVLKGPPVLTDLLREPILEWHVSQEQQHSATLEAFSPRTRNRNPF